MKFKICTGCWGSLPATVEFFHKQKYGKFGFRSMCKECCKREAEEYYEKNKEKRKKYSRNYQQTPKGIKVQKAAKKLYRQSDKGKETEKKYNQTYKQSEKGRIWWEKYNLSEKSKLTRRKIRKKHYRKYKLAECMSTGIWQSLKKNKKGRHWELLVSYTFEELALHLQGTIGLTTKIILYEFWQNFYGEYYHVDHKRPKVSFDKKNLQDPSSKEFRECWSLENLQLLLGTENCSKGSKWR